MNARYTHKAAVRRTSLAVAASTMAASLAACSVANGGDSSSTRVRKGNDITVGLLLPDRESSRYDKFDYPIIKTQVAALTKNRGRVVYANGEHDAGKQNRQLEQMIADKVDVLLVDPVNAQAIAPSIKKAKEAGIPVIAYDRLAQGPIDAYISFDNELIGQMQGHALVEALGSNATRNKIIMMNGSPTDPNTAQFKQGALDNLSRMVIIARSYDIKDWKPENAKANMQKAIQAIGAGNIAGVYAANDGIAGAVIEALKEAGVSKLPPVTGQDAELAAVRRIVSGDQYMTVYKPYLEEASQAAYMAVAKVQWPFEFDALTGKTVTSPTNEKIPARFVPVVALTKDNIKGTVIQDGIYAVKDICTAKYKLDCVAIGLK